MFFGVGGSAGLGGFIGTMFPGEDQMASRFE
jgi:hypothetical protein